MKNLTQEQRNQVVGGNCPLFFVLGANAGVMISYLLWASFSNKNYGVTGVIASVTVGTGLGMIAWMSNKES